MMNDRVFGMGTAGPAICPSLTETPKHNSTGDCYNQLGVLLSWHNGLGAEYRRQITAKVNLRTNKRAKAATQQRPKKRQRTS
jgi:hypothetical protein